MNLSYFTKLIVISCTFHMVQLNGLKNMGAMYEYQLFEYI